MKVSASIYSNKTHSLKEVVEELNHVGVDLLHIDCKDNPKVFEDIKEIKQICDIPVDLHLITDSPDDYWHLIEESKTDLVTLQYENLKSDVKIPSFLDGRIGIAFTSNTPIDVFEPIREKYAFALFMTTVPGESGGVFNKKNFKRIRQFQKRFPRKRIHVDGGVNREVSFILKNMGVYSAVSGSFLFNSRNIGTAIAHLNSSRIETHIKVKDVMFEIDESPLVKENELTFKTVLETIDQNNFGFTIVSDSNQYMKGIITNADIRKGLLRNIQTLNELDANELINHNPAKIYEEQTITEMLDYLNSLTFPVHYAPVVDSEGKVKGTMSFNNLIKGES